MLNTPSHHRVHHGANEQYLDRNYGGILVIWDRLFRSFEPEGERVRYGLTTNIGTFNPVQVAFHEYGALWRDLRVRALVAGPLEPAAPRARLQAAAYLSRRESRRSLRTRPSVWSRGQ